MVDDCGAGDALKASGWIRAVRNGYPTARITLLVSEAGLPVFERSDLTDRVVASRLYRRRHRGRARVRAARAVEALRLAITLGRGYDLVIYFWWGTTLLHVIGRWATKGPCIGYAQNMPGLLTSRLGPYDFRSDEVEQSRCLLREAGIELGIADPLAPELGLDDADRTAARERLATQGIAASRPFMVLHPGSDWACQQWLPSRWAALADRLAVRYGAGVVFTGTASEASLIDAARFRMRSDAASLAGATTIRQLAALLAQAQLCVCVDSAARVIAQAVGAPMVVLAGPSRPQGLIHPRHPATVLNRASDRLAAAIQDCKESKYGAGGCLDHACPMAGLRDLEVAHALEAVERMMTGTAHRVEATLSAAPDRVPQRPGPPPSGPGKNPHGGERGALPMVDATCHGHP